jgi:hypothetical protein
VVLDAEVRRQNDQANVGIGEFLRSTIVDAPEVFLQRRAIDLEASVL